MIDIYLIQTILNICWYIFSIIFVLYKFTSFFSYIFNFIKFLGKITQVFVYLKDQIVSFFQKRRNQYVSRTNESETFVERFKKGVRYIFSGSQTDLNRADDLGSYESLWLNDLEESKIAPTRGDVNNQISFSALSYRESLDPFKYDRNDRNDREKDDFGPFIGPSTSSKSFMSVPLQVIEKK